VKIRTVVDVNKNVLTNDNCSPLSVVFENIFIYYHLFCGLKVTIKISVAALVG
jgi:hypothetical protein